MPFAAAVESSLAKQVKEEQSKAGEKTHEYGSKAQDSAHETKEQAKGKFEETKEAAKDKYHRCAQHQLLLYGQAACSCTGCPAVQDTALLSATHVSQGKEGRAVRGGEEEVPGHRRRCGCLCGRRGLWRLQVPPGEAAALQRMFLGVSCETVQGLAGSSARGSCRIACTIACCVACATASGL